MTEGTHEELSRLLVSAAAWQPRGGPARPSAATVDPRASRSVHAGRLLDGLGLRPVLMMVNVGLLAGILIALGGAAWGWVTVEGFARVPAGMATTVALGQERYVVYAEGGYRLTPGQVAVTLSRHGVPVTVRPAASDEGFSLFGRTDASLAEVDVPVAGEYEVSATGPHGLPVAIALGSHDPMTRIRLGFTLGFGGAALLLVLGVGWAVHRLRRRPVRELIETSRLVRTGG